MEAGVLTLVNLRICASLKVLPLRIPTDMSNPCWWVSKLLYDLIKSTFLISVTECIENALGDLEEICLLVQKGPHTEI